MSTDFTRKTGPSARFSQIKKLLLLVMDYIYKDETYKIIGGAQEVHKEYRIVEESYAQDDRI